VKKIGMIGGFGPESTLDYYRLIIDQYCQQQGESEIELGQFLEETRNGLLAIIKRMINEDLIEGVILGCTELPLILTKDEFDIPFLNTTKIHVESALRYCLSENG